MSKGQLLGSVRGCTRPCETLLHSHAKRACQVEPPCPNAFVSPWFVVCVATTRFYHSACSQSDYQLGCRRTGIIHGLPSEPYHPNEASCTPSSTCGIQNAVNRWVRRAKECHSSIEISESSSQFDLPQRNQVYSAVAGSRHQARFR
jgi:hypothetical protein